MNGTTSSTYGFSGLKSSIGYNTGDKNRQDDKNMMEALMKNPGTEKQSNGQFGSNSNLATTGGLPGLRGRTRQSVSGSKFVFHFYYCLFYTSNTH